MVLIFINIFCLLFVTSIQALSHNVENRAFYSKQFKIFNKYLAQSILSVSLGLSLFNPPIYAAEKGTILVEEGEVARIYQKAMQVENDGDLLEAQKLYEQVVQVQPNFIDAWNNLGNVLTSQGNIDLALLCYKKAISLSPPSNELWVILLNKASIELPKGLIQEALADLTIAEKVGGPQPAILTNRAVVLTNLGDWKEACGIFEKVISSADRYALPWWLRYSMSLLESDRGMEAVAYLQRTLNRFPDETECKAYAVALYTNLGAVPEAATYWSKLSIEEKNMYRSNKYITETLHWGPKAVESFNNFLTSKYSKL